MPSDNYLTHNAGPAAAAKDEAFSAIQAHKLLILLLLSRCNNNCRFCMVDGEIQASQDMPLHTGQDLILKQEPGSRIEFFGGEPTIYPHFYELLSLARKSGHSCSVASNGRTFSSEKYTAQIAALGAQDIYIRTSLYGVDGETHDYYTRKDGSFEQTVRGIKNMVRFGFPCQVNVVVMGRNHKQLTHIVELAADLGVPRMKFGMLVNCGNNQEHLVRLNEIRDALDASAHRTLELGMKLTIEKAPFCLMPKFVSHFSCERLVAPSERMYAFDGPCGNCIVSRWCSGVDPDYMKLFGPEELTPVHAIAENQVKFVSPRNLEDFKPDIFETIFLAFDQSWIENETILKSLVKLEKRISHNLGELALIPLGLIDNEHSICT